MGRLIESIVGAVMSLPPVIMLVIAAASGYLAWDYSGDLAAAGTPAVPGEASLVHVGYGVSIVLVLLAGVRLMSGAAETRSRKPVGGSSVDVDRIMTQLAPGVPTIAHDDLPPVVDPVISKADPSTPLGRMQARAAARPRPAVPSNPEASQPGE